MELTKFLMNLLQVRQCDTDSLYLLCSYLAIALLSLVLCRLLYLICMCITNSKLTVLFKKPRTKPLKTMVVIGSGGHTMEMLRLMREMNPKHYSPRVYVMADTDTTSESKILVMEKEFSKKAPSKVYCKFSILKFPRSRHVGQSYFTSLFSTLFSILKCIPIMLREKPELILCNGPGTCVPICFIAFVMHVFYLSNSMIVFIESVCRVKSLSLSGQILYYFADVLLVQWQDLKRKYSRVIYIGRL